MNCRNLCKICGGDLRKIDDTHYACEFCHKVYPAETIERYSQKIGNIKRELLANARKNLYTAIGAKYISAQDVHNACIEIKKYLPDDYQANFYEAFLTSPVTDIAKMIRNIDVKENFDTLELMLTFLIKSLEQEFILDVAALIERAYKAPGSKNLVKYHEYESMLAEEAQKVNDGIYDVNLPRDVFIAYSSMDMEEVLALVDELENNQGLECFISVRNLRQGAGSRENYIEDLQTAMDNCKSFVFVSSNNSRRNSCDALRIELPYIQKKDFERSVSGGYVSYEEIPHKFKKPRVEYRLEESDKHNVADRKVDEFFFGYQRVYSPIDVAVRVMNQTSPIKPDNVKADKKPIPKKIKYCVYCLNKNDADAEQCEICGETNFESTLREAKAQKKEAKRIEKEKAKIKKIKNKTKKKTKKKKSESSNSGAWIWLLSALLMVGFVILGIVFENVRVWLIAGVASVAYVLIWNLIRKKTEINYVPWCIFTTICLGIAIIPLACISSTRPYAFCFAAALLVNAIGLLIQCWQDVSVEITKRKVNSNWNSPYEDVKNYSFKLGPGEYLLNLYSLFCGIVLFSVSLGVLFTGLPRVIIIGCGVGIAYIVIAIITKICLYTADLTGYVDFAFIVVGIVSFVFAFINYYLTIFTLCAMPGVVIAALMFIIFYRDSACYTFLVCGFIIAGVAVLTLLFTHTKTNEDFVVENGVLVSYSGSEQVVVIPKDVVEIGSKAFCFWGPQKNMQEVVLHNGITKIGENAFKKCVELERIVIPGSVETIGISAFANCDSLKELVLEEGIINIGGSAFDGCDNIVSVQLPKSIEKVGDYAFSECARLSKLYIHSGIQSLGTGVLANNGTKISIYYEGGESEWESIDKGGFLLKWTYCIREYDLIFNAGSYFNVATENSDESDKVAEYAATDESKKAEVITMIPTNPTDFSVVVPPTYETDASTNINFSTTVNGNASVEDGFIVEANPYVEINPLLPSGVIS